MVAVQRKKCWQKPEGADTQRDSTPGLLVDEWLYGPCQLFNGNTVHRHRGLAVCATVQCTWAGRNCEHSQTKFIQILNVHGCHWATVSDLFCEENQLAVYNNKVAPFYPGTELALSWLIRHSPAIQRFYSQLCSRKTMAVTVMSLQ